MSAVRVLTYNVHSCKGSDRRTAPERVISVIRRAHPSIAALQELASLSTAEHIASSLQMDLYFVAARSNNGASFGNAILSRIPGVLVRDGKLPQLAPRLEARAAQWVRFATDWGVLDVINTHLGLSRAERRLQADALLGIDWLSDPRIGSHVILCGDLNARPGSDAYVRLSSRLADAQVEVNRPISTFPSLFPVVRIDHVLISSKLRVLGVHVPGDLNARLASDHRPLLVDLMPT